MFKWLNDLLNSTIEYKDDEGPQIDIDIRAPKDKVGSCMAIVRKNIFIKSLKKGRWLCTNVGGDHFLVEVNKYEIYVEYLTTPAYKSMEKIWDKGLVL